MASPIQLTLLAPPSAPLAERLARLVVVAVVAGIGISTIILAVAEWPMGDLRVYLDAALRLRGGGDLYPAGGDPVFAYWYAPWFAYAWVPISYLPMELIIAGWSAVLLAATGWVGWRLSQVAPGGVVAALLIVPLLFGVSAGGNVQPLLVAALLARLDRGDGPLWVGIGASLKITPILLALLFLRDRAYGKAALAAGVTVALWLPAPALGFDPTAATAWSGVAPSLLGISPPLYAAALIAAALAVWVVRRPIAPLAAAVSAVLALPRLFAYDVTLVAVAAGAAWRSVAARTAGIKKLTS
jgi:Glycosyltransferase family 87